LKHTDMTENNELDELRDIFDTIHPFQIEFDDYSFERRWQEFKRKYNNSATNYYNNVTTKYRERCSAYSS